MSPIRSIFYRTSSFIKNVSWDPNSEVLLVQFSSGSTWMYHGVPKEVYESLVRSPSVGEYFNKNIRNKYICQTINKKSNIKEHKHGKEKQEKE